MKKIFIILLFIVVCIQAQDINKIITDEKTGKPMLIGLCDRTAFADTSFSWWFGPEYEYYDFDQQVIDSLKQIVTDDIEIKLVLGTWCGDSKREVPHFMRILDEINFDTQRITMLSVGRDKLIEGFDISNLEIEFVPTFIFYKNGIEIGRIVEAPLTVLEKDIKEILQKN